MNLTDPILELLAYEVALIFAVIAGVLLFKNLKKKRRVDADTAKTVSKIKQNRDQREAHLKTLLSEQYGLAGETLEEEAKAFADRERELYKGLLKVFINQDGKAFSGLPEQIEQAVNAALERLPETVAAAPEPAADESEQQADFEQVVESEQPAEPEAEAIAESEQADTIDAADTEDSEQLFSDTSFIETESASLSAEPEAAPAAETPAKTAEPEAEQADTDVLPDEQEPVAEDSPVTEVDEDSDETLRSDEIEALLEGQTFDLEKEEAADEPLDNAAETDKPGAEDIDIASEPAPARQEAETEENTPTSVIPEVEDEPVEVTDLDNVYTPDTEYRRSQTTDEAIERFADSGEDIEIPGDPDHTGSSPRPQEQAEQDTETAEQPAEKTEPAKKGLKDFVKTDSFNFQPQASTSNEGPAGSELASDSETDIVSGESGKTQAPVEDTAVSTEIESPLTEVDDKADIEPDPEQASSETEDTEQPTADERIETVEQEVGQVGQVVPDKPDISADPVPADEEPAATLLPEADPVQAADSEKDNENSDVFSPEDIEAIMAQQSLSSDNALQGNGLADNTAEPEPEKTETAFQTEAERLQLLMADSQEQESAEEAESPATELAEQETEEKPARSELEDLRAKLRARTAQLKAEAQTRQAEQPQSQTENDQLDRLSDAFDEAAPQPPVDDKPVDMADPEAASDKVQPNDEAAILEQWQQQLAGQPEDTDNSLTETPESELPEVTEPEPELSGPAREPEVQTAGDTEQSQAADSEDEAAMLAQWEQQLASETDDVQADPRQTEPEQEVTPAATSAFPESQGRELAEQEQAEQEAEAALAASWQQQVEPEADDAETNEEPLNPLPVSEHIEAESAPASQEEPSSSAPEEEEIDTGPPVQLTDVKVALSEMWDDLTEEPLPSEQDLESMFREIKQLDQGNAEQDEARNSSNQAGDRNELKSILSSIPSFSQMNKKTDS